MGSPVSQQIEKNSVLWWSRCCGCGNSWELTRVVTELLLLLHAEDEVDPRASVRKRLRRTQQLPPLWPQASKHRKGLELRNSASRPMNLVTTGSRSAWNTTHSRTERSGRPLQMTGMSWPFYIDGCPIRGDSSSRWLTVLKLRYQLKHVKQEAACSFIVSCRKRWTSTMPTANRTEWYCRSGANQQCIL